MKQIADYKDHLDRLWDLHLGEKDERLSLVSLFAGCGGSGLGYSMSGFRELAALEWWDKAADCIRENFGIPVIVKDIRETPSSEILSVSGLQEGGLYCLDMSPVCCGFSHAGKKEAGDDRNFLFRESARILADIKPKTFVMENVENLLSDRFGHIFWEMAEAFHKAGYVIAYKVLSASDFGSATMRRRLFVVGIRSDIGKMFSFPDPEFLPVSAQDALSCWDDKESLRPLTPLYRGYWEATAAGCSFPVRKTEKKINPLKPCYTILANSFNLFHWEEPRRVSAKEAARLQGFPDGFRFPTKDRLKWKMVGNSVCPPVMKAISSALRDQVEA